ncbi:MAG: monooxygenase [Halothiobacillus sp. 20-54-6]|nr:MAG: monooxygenase [Halothiobacillus sp. 20-54-6]
MSTTLNILIIGAGIGGLSAALAFQRLGHHVRIVERVKEIRPVGAAISLWPNGVKIMNQLGLGDTLAQQSGFVDHMRYLSFEGTPLTEFSLNPLFQQVTQRTYPISRFALQKTLFDEVGAEFIDLGRACVDFSSEDDGVTATFDDGSTLLADLLIVADGTHSRLRSKVVGHPVERQYVGYVNWNVRIPAELGLAPSAHWDQYVGENKRVSLMPMGTGGNSEGIEELYCFFDVPLPTGTPNDPATYRQELKQHFAHWAEPVQALIDRFDPALMARVEIHDIPPLESLTSDQVALLGDAAHGMAPDLGQGACQAMEDAWVLARAVQDELENLAASTKVALSLALKNYNLARVHRVGEIVSRARKRAGLIHGEVREKTQAWYDELAIEDGQSILDGIKQTVLAGPFG